MKKLFTLFLALVMLAGMAACGKTDTPDNTGDNAENATYRVGVCQLAQHPALDAATQGFVDALKEALGDDVKIDVQNASGESNNCSTIINGFLSADVDLIMANATPALTAAASATSEVPILGTAVTAYGVALDLDDFNGTVGGNISGTSDLAPLDQQAEMIPELITDVRTVGILYCSAEPNSVYQAEVVKAKLESMGITVQVYTFADSNDVAAVTATACAENEALYIPTDNTAASCAEAINNVAEPAGVAIIAGEEGICRGCGIAALSISYYDIGYTTGQMAARILRGEAEISTMPIEYYPNPVKKYNPTLCEALNIVVPEGYVAIGD